MSGNGIKGEVILQSVGPLAQCSQASASWTGGLPPYEVQAYAVLSDAPRIVARTNETHATWLCDYPAGTNVAITVWDRRNESIYYGYDPDNIVGDGPSSCTLTNATGSSGWTPVISPSSSVSSSQTSSSSALSGAPSASSGASGESQNQAGSSTPIGAIVGGVVGGVGGLLLIAALVWWLYRRRRSGPEEPKAPFEIEDEYERDHVTPFHQPPPPAQQYAPKSALDSLSTTTSPPTAAYADSDSRADHAEDAGPADQLPPVYGNWKQDQQG